MDDKSGKSCLDDDIMKVLTNLSFTKEKLTLYKSEKLRMEKLLNAKNEEIMKVHEAETFYTTQLEENKRLISEQQATISKLMSVKEEMKKFKDVINAKDQRILQIEKEKYDLAKEYETKADEKFKENIQENQNLKDELKEVRNELSIAKSESVCKTIKAEEDVLQAKAEKDEQINKLVLEYEEKLQRAHAQYLRMKDEIHNITEKSNSSIAAYKEKIFNLEQKKNPRTNIVKPNMAKSTDVPKINQTRFQYPPTASTYQTNSSNYGNKFQNKDITHVSERPPSRASNVASFQLVAKQKPANLLTKYNTASPQISMNSETNDSYSMQIDNLQPESTEEKKKTLKRKLFSKFSEEFEETDSS